MTRARILADYVAGGSTAAEFDVLDGLTSTTAELNHVDGVTSNVQTQLDAKLPLAGGTMTGNIVMGDDTSIGIGDSAERIEFDGAGDISVLGANLGIGEAAPDQLLHCTASSGDPYIVVETQSGGGAGIKLIGTDTNQKIQVSGGLQFYTGATTTANGTARMTLASNGDVTYGNQPICVYSGWNANANTTSGSRVDYTLDSDRISVNTTYLTKSTNTFTCVKAGNYQVNFNTMSNVNDGDYVHHRMTHNTNHYFQTHSYGGSGTDNWYDYRYCVNITLAVNETIEFDAYSNGAAYLWHNAHSYSQLSIIFLHI